ncbi:uncharacterized protein LOC132031819 [Lycium ferocissimum]|uniref:uncharacterized protein LOC132031819 n=1 Tax=Lycium ferocissimum TaxID=112874 RepID=UPI0028167270|nr:uncharacterized protein LOC132031819 [Lycium ferocissimum]
MEVECNDPMSENKGDIRVCDNYRGIEATKPYYESVGKGDGDEEKAYDKVRGDLWRCLEAKGGPMAYIRVIKDMCRGSQDGVRTVGGDSEHFPVVMGLRRGSASWSFCCLGDG